MAKWHNLFSWLEYEVSTDLAFCFISKQYTLKKKEKNTFKSGGFKDWKNAKKHFENHENSEIINQIECYITTELRNQGKVVQR